MEKPTLSLLGQSMQISDVEKESLAFLRDPFSVTRADLIGYCLKELAEVLHLTVVHTYVQLPKYQSSQFYLIGYKDRTGWSNYRPRIYGDPESCPEGTEIKWLLRNLRWYWRKYAEYMELDDDAYDDITGFLLFDVIQNAYADCGNDRRTFIDDNLVQHCFEASMDLIIAICESTYYETIAKEVAKNRHNLEILMPLVAELKTYQIKQTQVQDEDLETRKVLEFLKCSSLIGELEREDTRDNNPVERPLTNYFLYTVIPRFKDLSLINDSGIESGTCDGNNYTNEQIQGGVTRTIGDGTFLPLEQAINQTLDGSMVVINQFQSTPIPKERQKKNTEISKIYDSNKNDERDGSYVLV